MLIMSLRLESLLTTEDAEEITEKHGGFDLRDLLNVPGSKNIVPSLFDSAHFPGLLI